jgi:hypothetical protein
VRLGQRDIWRSAVTAAFLVAVAVEMIGCQAQPAQWPELGRPGAQQQKPRERALRIVPQSNREVADLSPDDIVSIMRQIGFTDDQILELGTDMHDALMVSGGARVLYKEQTEALLAINGAQVYIRSNARGNLVYDLGSGQFFVPDLRR